jgi:meiotically up-regulated gene 157 (Mug157) protein
VDKVAIFILYDRAIDEEVMDLLTSCCIEYYTRWHDVSGVGSTGPHLGDHVWPALNNVMMTVVDEERKAEILERVRRLQEDFPFTGLRAVVLPVLDMV